MHDLSCREVIHKLGLTEAVDHSHGPRVVESVEDEEEKVAKVVEEDGHQDRLRSVFVIGSHC